MLCIYAALCNLRIEAELNLTISLRSLTLSRRLCYTSMLIIKRLIMLIIKRLIDATILEQSRPKSLSDSDYFIRKRLSD